MPFPYLAPLKDWIVDVLDDREKNPNDTTLRMPWAILASGALVVKTDAKGTTSEEKTKKLQVTSRKIFIAGQSLIVTSIRDLTKWVKFEKQR